MGVPVVKTPVSLFDESGVDVGSTDRNMAYLYGMSDFFTFIFEDTETTNLLMESGAVKASDIYSKFLQISSSLSLETIQETIGTSIKLLLINKSTGNFDGNEFTIDEPIQSARHICNRPFLPTQSLEDKIDFEIEQLSLTQSKLRLARPINTYKFSQRILPGGEIQYAIWLTDVEIDEQLMYKHFGKLIGVTPEISDKQFSDFVYGLYYLYYNGPTLTRIEQGLNIVLGVPLPREASRVLDIRITSDTGQYIVITEAEAYELPIGILPSVQIGDIAGVGSSIAKWVDIQDFWADGKWWINVSIPSRIIRSKPISQPNRIASSGTRFDQIMSDYLYKNTFLIRIDVNAFIENKYFTQLSSILSSAKPVHDQAIVVWRLRLDEEVMEEMEEINFTITQIFSDENSINAFPINDKGIVSAG